MQLNHTLPAYDVVIATRNRREALWHSIPILLKQAPPPSRLIVIDASDDHEAVVRTVRRAVGDWSGKLIVEQAVPGLPAQRNRGLRHVTAPITLFPDDDSLLHHGAARHILEVYARDTENRIAAVCAAEAVTPPHGALLESAWKMSRVHRGEARLRRLRNRLERRFTVLKPAMMLGRALNARHACPHWLGAYGVVPVEYMTGFRMSFRTEVIRQSGFDENLRGYAVDEDIDASFSAMARGLVVGAKRARIYHHRFPGRRANAFEQGRMEVLNRRYVLNKHAVTPVLAARVRRRNAAFVALKLVLLLRGILTAEGRARLGGALSGLRVSLTPLSSASTGLLIEPKATPRSS